MRIDLYVHGDLADPLITLNQKVDHLMATMAELQTALSAATDSLTAIGAEVDKIGTETTGLQKQVTDLQAAIAAGGGTTPAVDAALAVLQGSLASLATKE